MAAVDSVITQSTVGVDGNAYTSSVSNDTLTNEDFLTLMLEEMKQQDPTEPSDSSQILNDQLQMSSIQANEDMSTAMNALQASYENSALSSAASMIGRNIKDGSLNDSGEDKVYAVETVESKDGILYLNSKEFTGLKDALKLVDGDTETYLDYDQNGYILENGANVDGDVRVSLDTDGRFEYNSDGSLKLLDTDNTVITDTAITDIYKYATTFPLYSEDVKSIELSSVVEVS